MTRRLEKEHQPSFQSTEASPSLPATAARAPPPKVPIGNGGVTDKYYWTQTLYELTVYADVPKGTRAKDVHCDISPNSLELRLKSCPDRPILKGKMPVR